MAWLPARPVGPAIDLAPGAEKQPLARHLGELVRSNVVRNEASRSAFAGLRGAVTLIADDHGTALTLRFDFGRLVIHTGVVGVPDVTIRAPHDVLASLGEGGPLRFLPFVWAVASGGLARAALGGRAAPSGPRAVKVYGLSMHPVLVRRLLTVLSRTP